MFKGGASDSGKGAESAETPFKIWIHIVLYINVNYVYAYVYKCKLCMWIYTHICK